MCKNSKQIIFIFFSTILIIIFISLGFWQLKRKTYKDNLMNEINIQINLPEIEYKDFSSKFLEKDNKLNKLFKDSVNYRKFKFSGKFNNNIKLFVYGSNNESQKNGYFLLTPFILNDGKTILVLRGWMGNINNHIPIKQVSEFSGLTIKSDSSGFFTPEPDLNNMIFFSFDLEKIKKSLKIDSENFFAIENLTDSGLLQKVNTEKFVTIYNRHFEYIITWFTLAFFTFIMLITNIKRFL